MKRLGAKLEGAHVQRSGDDQGDVTNLDFPGNVEASVGATFDGVAWLVVFDRGNRSSSVFMSLDKKYFSVHQARRKRGVLMLMKKPARS